MCSLEVRMCDIITIKVEHFMVKPKTICKNVHIFSVFMHWPHSIVFMNDKKTISKYYFI